MQINQLIEGIDLVSLSNLNNQEINKVSFHCEEKCDLFINLKTDVEQSLKDIEKAKLNGAKVVVTQNELSIDLPQVVVKDVRSAMALMACNFYGNPSKKMKIIGITGTNGKTTSTYIIKSILENAGYKVGLIGTNCNIIDNQILPAHLTTPDPFELQSLLKQMSDNNCDYVVMEVSAHSLYFNKVDGIYF